MWSGTWKENRAKAQMAQSEWIIEPTDNGIRIASNLGPMLTAGFDEKEYPGSGPFANDRFKVKKIGKNDYQIDQYRDGQHVMTERDHVTDDGRKLTRTLTTHHAKGGNTINVFTYNRKGDQIGSPYPYIGSWTADPTATKWGAENTIVIAQNGDVLTWTNPVSGAVMTINVPNGQVTETGTYVPKDLTRKFNRIDDHTIEMVNTHGADGQSHQGTRFNPTGVR